MTMLTSLDNFLATLSTVRMAVRFTQHWNMAIFEQTSNAFEVWWEM